MVTPIKIPHCLPVVVGGGGGVVINGISSLDGDEKPGHHMPRSNYGWLGATAETGANNICLNDCVCVKCKSRATREVVSRKKKKRKFFRLFFVDLRLRICKCMLCRKKILGSNVNWENFF